MRASIVVIALGFGLAIGPVGQRLAQSAGVALAQSGPPVRLAPRKPSGGTTARPPAERRGGIREERLGRVNPESIGVLDDANGGFGDRIWAGTPRSTVAGLTPRLATRYRSPALRDLARRLLLSRAAAPRGLIVGKSLVTLRLERLYGMGALEGAAALSKAVPRSVSGPRLAILQVDIAFLTGDTKRACAVVDRQLGAHDTLALQRANVICQALERNVAKAMLALGLLREQEGVPDETWEALVEAVAQRKKDEGHKTQVKKTKGKKIKGKKRRARKILAPQIKVSSLKQATPGHLVLMAALDLALPADAAESDDLAVLRRIALMKAAPAELRLLAGEKAAAAGALSGAELGRVYAAVPIDAAEIAQAVARARKTFDARARARLFKAAARARNPRRRARILRTVWSLARKHGGYPVAARVFAPFVADMAPDPDLRRFAPYAARALYSAGEVQLATAWYRLLLDGPPGEAAAHLWPIARLAAPERILWDDARLAHWARLQRRDGRNTAERRIAILHALFQATGDADAQAANWAALLPRLATAGNRGAVPRLWRSMRGAAVARRRGETVLAALAGIEGGDLSKLDEVDLRLVLLSLRDVGLTRALRAVALEAALANRL
jgi:hypothetical protein